MVKSVAKIKKISHRKVIKKEQTLKQDNVDQSLKPMARAYRRTANDESYSSSMCSTIRQNRQVEIPHK
jgi:hypothetical protein